MAKTEQLQIRVSPEEKSLIRARATQAGVGMSDWVLLQLFPPVEARFRECLEALVADPDRTSFTLAELHDLLAGFSGRQITHGLRNPPGVSLPPVEANYVAAMTEFAAMKCGVPPPAWTGDVPPLDRPWFGTDLMSLRLHLLTNSPAVFRRRNIFIDTSVGGRV